MTTASAAVEDCTPDATFNICKRFTFSGSNQSFTVPAGVSSINVRVWAAGGGGFNSTYSPSAGGGSGGFTTGTVAVTPGAQLGVVVGEGGKINSAIATYGGGGAGGSTNFPVNVNGGSSGGGLSGVFSSTSITQGAALLIAGGAAGSSNGMSSGLFGPGGGGTSGRQNTVTISYRGLPGGPLQLGGAAGTQTSGGAAATYRGWLRHSHHGYRYRRNCWQCIDGGKGADNGEGGGGGGGGYYGGGGGRCQLSGPNAQNGPGGGGSGYVGARGQQRQYHAGQRQQHGQQRVAAPEYQLAIRRGRWQRWRRCDRP